MWLLMAFLSAVLLGLYDLFKKQSLHNNAVIPVLFLNTLFSSLIFIPLIITSAVQPGLLKGVSLYIPQAGWGVHKYVLLKSVIVLGSWTFGYFGLKHLPITIAGPVSSTRPMIVLVGALVLFGEQLNLYQWAGVILALVSFFMLGRSGKIEGIDFRNNRWVWFIVAAALLGASSALFDRYLLAPGVNGGLGIDRMVVQSWFNIYQCIMMSAVLAVLWYPQRRSSTPFQWKWSIIGISVFLAAADFVYFYSLSLDGAMISVVSMARRSSVVVSFMAGAFVFREKNLRSKIPDLVLLLAGMVFLYIGSS